MTEGKKRDRSQESKFKKGEENNSAIDTPHSEINELTTDHSQLTTKMEVHHHPQLHHEKKPWKEYLLEGLMIFLAVLMGFIAESIREGLTEHKRAAEFAASYYQDIKKDTSQMNKALRLCKHKMAAIDSMVTVLHQPLTPRADTILTYKSLVASMILPFEPSSGSFEGIKASGSVRNFKQKMINLMNEYDLQARSVLRRDEIMQKFVTEQLIPFGLDSFNFENSYDVLSTGKISHELYGNFDGNGKRKYINIVVFDKVLVLRSVQEHNKLMVIAKKVLAELKNEYSLEDE